MSTDMTLISTQARGEANQQVNASKPSPWRRRFKRLGLYSLLLLVLATLCGSIYEQLARRRASKEFPPPGKLIDIGGRRIHLDCRGSGTPLVVLESGADTSGSALWALEHDAVARLTRVCSYDRAGLMWSDPAPEPRDGIAIVNDLHKALQVAHESAPYVMVGASLGGPLTMIFTQHFGEEVAGLVFVDAAHPEQTRRTEQATGRKEESIPLLFSVLADLAWTGLPRLLLPAPNVPELPPNVVKAIGAYQAPSLRPAFDEAAIMESVFREAGAFRNLGDRPLAVLTRGKPYDAYSEAQRVGSGMTREQFERREAEWLAMQDEEARWSSQSTHRRLEDASHVIQLERPDAVIAAISEVVERVRAGKTAP
jgi:pimeloyl-ACP methyl ester carboxylesterase